MPRLSRNNLNWLALGAFCLVSGCFFLVINAKAQTKIELEQKIADHNQKIIRLEQEIAEYEKKLTSVNTEAVGLKGELSRLELTRKKLQADISLTEEKIAASQNRLRELADDISLRDKKIIQHESALRSIFRTFRHYDGFAAVEVALAYDRWSDFWRETDNLIALEAKLETEISHLDSERSELQIDHKSATLEQARLDQLKSQLFDQRKIVENNKNYTADLLQETKNEEANYRQILADRKQKKEAFERELFELESQLRVIINPNSLPAAGQGVLRWPLESITITQQFGKTVDARRLYASGTHNGVDFRAAVGTPVKAALQGQVIGVGDTDLVCPKASYGRWILIRHPNGLSTLYAHLSLIKITEGQIVNTGDVIGYSGNTGYTTGPHLHFTVYATQGVEIIKHASRVCRGTYTLPVAPPNAYLDPLIYL